jgi:hypothetical protein
MDAVSRRNKGMGLERVRTGIEENEDERGNKSLYRLCSICDIMK